MGKKISTSVSSFIIVTLLLISVSVALAENFSSEEFSYIGECHLNYMDPKFAKPFRIGVDGELGSPTIPVTIDYVLSNDIMLLDGNLHWSGNPDSNGEIHKALRIEINKPGTYEVSATINAPIKPNHFPLHLSLFFYARGDTIAQFYSRADMEKAIKHSMIEPYDTLVARQNRRLWNAHLEELKKNGKPVLTPESLSSLNLFGRSFSVSDSNFRSYLTKKYSPEQFVLIDNYRLMPDPIGRDSIENFIDKLDWISGLTTEKRDTLVKTLQSQLIQLFEIDQKILKTEQSDDQNRMLSERKTLIHHQSDERKKMVGIGQLDAK